MWKLRKTLNLYQHLSEGDSQFKNEVSSKDTKIGPNPDHEPITIRPSKTNNKLASLGSE